MKNEQKQTTASNQDERKSKKRKRHDSTKKQQHHEEKEGKNSNDNKNSSKNSAIKGVKPLKGLILAISTLDVKDKKHASADLSYQAVSSLCTDLGAQVTGQVHKKVFAVICSRSAVTQLTQRVRKAIKKAFVHLIDIEWIKQCKLEGQCVNHEKYLLTEMAKDLVQKRSHISKAIEGNTEEKESLGLNENNGWTEPISLDCCCVCHEDDRDDCEWCVNCTVTRAKKLKLE